MEFGHELKRIRESRGMTVNQLAMYSGVSAATISRVENKKRGIPRPKYIKMLAEALKYDYSDLMRLAGYADDKIIRDLSTEETEVDRKRKLGLEYIDRIKDDKTLDLAIELLEKLSKE